MANNDIVVSKFLPPAELEVETDLDYTRKNMITLIETGMAGLEEFSQLAAQSQNPGSYEVLFKAIGQLTSANKALADLTVKKRDEAKPDEDQTEAKPSTVNQNLFVGSTADLAEMLKAIEEKKKSE